MLGVSATLHNQIKALKHIRSKVTRLFHQLQPISSLVRLFQRDIQFRYEIFRTLCTTRLSYISANTCATSEQLLRHHKFSFTRFRRQILIQTNYSNRESLTFCLKQHCLFSETSDNLKSKMFFKY